MTDVISANLQTGEITPRPFTPEELAANEQHLAALEVARPERERQAHNAPIQAQIAALDAKRLRPSAEMTLAIINGEAPNPADVARLNELTAEIAALRAGLLP